MDNNEAALAAMARRFVASPDVEFIGYDPLAKRDDAACDPQPEGSDQG
ncbi:MAG: hypothetical protein U0232_03725 [Thermomicrobiales bacterium]